eukprot:TRINITY_DN17371_c0_g1_i1.p1 TRINITY_DN17371_c0_g1~~TRINITY_DN17371_c0_g1_i1.p1  ORF type:complete len:224 (+),score=64.83 TRINITY_DN17371_c0_g1_i1:56-673(+)
MSGQIQLDALPYIDPGMTAAQRQEIEAMIDDEMENFPEQDYLVHLPVPKQTISQMLNDEMMRVAQGKAPAPLDRSRYDIAPPKGANDGDMAAWTKAIQNAQAQYQHQVVRNTNLELLNEYGKDAWLGVNEQTKREVAQTEERIAAAKRKIDDLNSFRKHKQRKAARTLREAESEWMELCAKNLRIQLETEKLEREMAGARGFEVA